MESHLRFSHGVVPVKSVSAPAVSNAEEAAEQSTSFSASASVTEAAEAMLRTLTPQPDYLLRCLTPLPLDTLDDFLS